LTQLKILLYLCHNVTNKNNMKKGLKNALVILGVIVVLLIIIGLSGWFYVKKSLLDFEGDYAAKRDLKEITVDGYTFLDRNENGKLDTYEDGRKATNDRVKDLLSQMTVEEKIHLLKGSGMASAMGMVEPGEGIPGVVGTIVPTPRLGIPAINLSDGPAGLRIQPKRKGEDRTFYCTAFPIGTLLSSTWNENLVENVGKAMGNEALEYGIDVILGPGANIHRHPFCGRNFEYYSEDPVLTGNIGAAIINGIESNGVGTAVKHFVANNQETNRNYNDVIISDRAMREIYLRGFEIIVKKAQPWTIMSSYNKVNGIYVPENKALLTDILRDEWEFEGLVMTDWFGGQDAPAMIKAGNDLLEPGTNQQWKALSEAYEKGELSIEEIDIAVSRILKLIINSKKMQNYQFGENPDLEQHAELTRKSASEGMVLLKNDNTLPLKEVQKVALLGVTSYDFIAGGTGSGDVNEAYSVSLAEGLNNVGLSIDESAKNIYEEHKLANKEAFVKPEGLEAMTNPYNPPEIAYTKEQLEQIAANADMAIMTIGRNSGEGGDRREKDDFLLSTIEIENIKLTCEVFQQANKKVVIVMNIGGVIETASWKAQPDAILLAWQGGQEGGNAVADILMGKVNPSGKLPMTFPVNISDHASHANFPLNGKPFDIFEMLVTSGEKPENEKIKNEDYTNYEEGIYVGYRHFDKEDLVVSYPFGFGLSYTDFEFGDMVVGEENDTINITLSVKNIGEVNGKEVVQCYVSLPTSVIDRPKLELKAFTKTQMLAPEQTEEISINIPVNDLRYWDEGNATWNLESGKYMIQVGASSRDIKQIGEIEL